MTEQAALDRLRELRDSIDNMDAALVHLLAERFKCTQAVGKLKAEHGMPPADKDREAWQIARLRELRAQHRPRPDLRRGVPQPDHRPRDPQPRVDQARRGGLTAEHHSGTSCWPPSTSYVAPVRAVLLMRCTASAATSAGCTTLPIGSVARSWSRRCSRSSPSNAADNGGVDEAGSDEVDPDRRHLHRERGDQGRQGGGAHRDHRPTRAGSAAAGAAHEHQAAAGSHLPDGEPGDPDGEPLVLVERSARDARRRCRRAARSTGGRP